MSSKNKQIVNDWLQNHITEMKNLDIFVKPEHMQRFEKIAEMWEVTPGVAASFILFAYINDLDLLAEIEKRKLNN